jgi:amino acid adenylation domain-containing protein
MVSKNESDPPRNERRALLADLLRKRTEKPIAVPLSFAQKRFWFIAQLDPQSPAYNIARALRMTGCLSVSALRETLRRIVARHDALRANFDTVNGEPMQFIRRGSDVKVPIIDLQDLSASARELAARRLIAEEALRPFDLTKDHLLRASVLRLGNEEHILLLTIHHIVSDGWSLGILTREIATIYSAITEQKPVDLPVLPIQYADFARWQEKWLQSESLEKHLSYWRRQLAETSDVLALPLDRPRPAVQTFRGGHYSTSFSSRLHDAVAELSRRERATLFMVLLAAFQTLLMRYSGQRDIVVGSPIAGRNQVETEDLIGCFVNSLVLRTDFSGNPTFLELLRQVKETALEAYENQNVPFEKLVEELHPERSLSRSPIFQVMFALQTQPRSALRLPALSISPIERETEAAKLDLSLYMLAAEDGLEVYFEYNADLFNLSTVRRMAQHLQILLEEIVANPDRRISEFSLIDDAERRLLLVEWNQTRSEFPRNTCVHDLFEKEAARRPDAVAIELAGESMSYGELDRRANQLAHYLRKRGVVAEAAVGICAERSFEMIVGLLGILKAGGVYVPLDPHYPQERLSFMLEDAGASVLLLQERLRDRLPPKSATVIALDTDWKNIARESQEHLENHCTAENLAYMIYTSGSTGRPKGVSVTHRGVVRLVRETNYARFGQDEVFLQFAPISFDASTFEIWGSLLNGARLVLAPPGLPTLAELGELIKDRRVTTLWLTAGLFHQMIETEVRSLGAVRQLLAGGDVLSPRHAEKAAALSDCQLINGYGPTENTTFTCCYRVRAAEKFAGSIPIGYPISNTEVYILDAEMKPAPIGVAGELYIGGDGLARGYVNDAILTAEAFLPHPFSANRGQRVYRTGDRARFLEDGRIEFLGRLDEQVKIRGFRIELGEIETVLSQHPRVRECAVLTLSGPNGDKRLVAYFVPQTKRRAQPEELRVFLKQKLPAYMVPTFFVELEKLPLTANGKVERRALPEPEMGRTELKGRVAPRTDAEERLAQIWTRILGRRDIGLRDNFFDLGGHSLLAVRLMAEIEREFGQRLPLISLFQDATIEYLAEILSKGADSISWPTLVEIQPGGPRPALFCISAPNVNALGYHFLARYLGSDRAIYGLQAQYPEDLLGEHSQAVVDKVATEYLVALRKAQLKGPYQFVGMCRGAHIAFEMARRLVDEGEKVALLGVLDTWVMENTYNSFWYVEYYFRRWADVARLGLRPQWNLIKRKANDVINAISGAVSGSSGANPPKPTKNPLHDVYFPGPDYAPRTYAGRISVFRARKQPFNRIRDEELGWGRLSTLGIDVHTVPGIHERLLREPSVQILARELRSRLLEDPDQAGPCGSSVDSHSNQAGSVGAALAILVEFAGLLFEQPLA